jgi:ribonuclease R
MEINDNGEVVSYQIKPTIINSNHRFTYEDAQKVINGSQKSAFHDSLKNMMKLSKILSKRRFEEGGIDFETPEVSFELDSKGFPTKIIRKERLESHRLIEEFMLAANRTVAKHIEDILSEKHKFPFIYRVHEKPDDEKMTSFFEFLRALNINFQPTKKVTSQYFQALLNSIKGRKEEIVIEEVALRSMMKAIYSTINIGHFGLGFKDYTHFTSPIRRYPDLMVHRLLKQYNQETQKAVYHIKQEELNRICEHSNKTERTAMEAERESIRLKQVEYISQKIGEEYKGVISGVMSFGIFVELIDTLVEGLVHIKNLEDDFYIYDEKTYTLVGRDSGSQLRLGDEVNIRVDKVNLEDGKVDFALIH